MEINKIVAKAEMKIFGGVPKVFRYWDDFKIRNIEILHCEDTPLKGVTSYATIGLNSIDIGLISNEKTLRVELMVASDIKNKYIPNIIASTAFEIMKTKKCYPGYLLEDIIGQYMEDTEMKHILLTDPFLWSGCDSIIVDNMYVAWLMIVPISQSEYNYAVQNGSDALEELFEEYDIDIFNIYRNSIL